MNVFIRTLLVVSVFLNVLAGGFIFGSLRKTYQDEAVQDEQQALSPESRHYVARTFQDVFRAIREAGDKARKLRAKLIAVLVADTFDAAAFDKAVAEFMKAQDDIRNLKVQTVRKVALHLNAHDRVNMAARMGDMIGGGAEKPVARSRKPLEMRRLEDEGASQ